jgi:formate dehydrogenase
VPSKRKRSRSYDASGPVAGAQEIAAIETALLSHGTARDGLLETFLDIRDRQGSVSQAGLQYMAERLRLTSAEVYEVATAFPAVNYGATVPYRNDTNNCGDLVCALLRGPVDIDRGMRPGVCGGRCDVPDSEPAPRSFEAFLAAGGYTVVDRLQRTPTEKNQILQNIAGRNAVGRAGVGFPVHRKWQSLIASGGETVVIVNADEGELATFKDRFILQSDPHGVLESALVAASVTGAKQLFFYLRDDYADLHAIVRRAIDDTVAAGLTAGLDVHLRRSGGAYICGEETALIASLEGRPARPRERPPYPTERGLQGRPTLVHNVETLYRLRGAWGAVHEDAVPVSALLDPDMLLYSVSGRVRKPGPKLIRALPSLDALVRAAGGMREEEELGGVVIGGSAGTIVPASRCGVPLAELLASGLSLGTGSAVVFGKTDDIRWIAEKMAGFLARESCGQCAPCRIGTAKMARALAGGPLDRRLLDDLASVMSEASICGLGRSAGKFLARVTPILTEHER